MTQDSNDPELPPPHPPQPKSSSSTMDEDHVQEALKSTRWFAYIAVGIILAAMCLGLAVMARVVYLFFQGLG